MDRCVRVVDTIKVSEIRSTLRLILELCDKIPPGNDEARDTAMNLFIPSIGMTVGQFCLAYTIAKY